MQHQRVLVLDGDMTPALAVVRSLGRMGLHVDVASHTGGDSAIAGQSRYARCMLRHPDPLTDETAFLAWCENIIDQGAYQLIVPVTERSVVPMQKLLNHAGGERIAIASPDALAIVLDKDKTLALAENLGIPAPRSVLIERMEDIAANLAALKLPLVIKPARSIGADAAGRKQLSVEYAFSARDLETKTERFLRYGPVLLQEYFAGEGVGIELIARHGEIEFAFQHLRLHEVPLTGGGSSLRMSVPIEPELLDASQKLMRALNWHGVAMVEFKWNPADRSYSLMEINGRFWGSLPLAIAAGADFPAMLYELLTTDSIATRPAAKTGVYCRKLSSDLYWHEMVLRRDAPANLVRFPSNGQILKDVLLTFLPRHHFDVQQWRDLKPGLIDLGRIARSYYERIARLRAERRERRHQLSAWQNGLVANHLKQGNQVLFVCYGNINRSSLAERYFSKIAPNTALKVLSAGFHDEAGRPADPVMKEVAGEAGIDLKAWSSRQLNAEMLAQSSVVFVMELKHLQRIQQEFPQAAAKTFLLNAGARVDKQIEIPDPYGKERVIYQKVCSQVMRCVELVAKLTTDAPVN